MIDPMEDDPRRRIAGWRVRDVMSSPIRACAPDLSLTAAAELMAQERIHCLAVVADPAAEGEEAGFLGVLSDLDRRDGRVGNGEGVRGGAA
jgi:CBS-domain-containing membrane protein